MNSRNYSTQYGTVKKKAYTFTTHEPQKLLVAAWHTSASRPRSPPNSHPRQSPLPPPPTATLCPRAAQCLGLAWPKNLIPVSRLRSCGPEFRVIARDHPVQEKVPCKMSTRAHAQFGNVANTSNIKYALTEPKSERTQKYLL